MSSAWTTDRDLRRPRPFPRAGESHTGFMHLYLYSLRRGILEQVTKGPWEVTQLVGTDGRRVWFLSTETSPLRRNLYSVRLDGKDKQRLTTGEGYTISAERRDEILHHHLFQRRDPQPSRRSATPPGNPSARWPTVAACAKNWPPTTAPRRSSSPSRPSAATRSTPTWSNPAASIPRSVTPYC